MKIKKILLFLAGIAFGVVGTSIIKNKKIKENGKNAYKFLALFRLMNQYVVTKQLGKSVVDYFHEKGIKKVAIYGMSHIGQRIIDDLKGSDIEVLYGIDRRADRLTYELEIYHPEDDYPAVDAIVVTAYDFDEIAELLSGKMDCEIISFEDVIYGI